MDSKEYSRDGYDLQYERSLRTHLPSPRGAIEEQPNDPDVVEITNLENAIGSLVSKRNSYLNQESRNLKIILDEAQFLFHRLKELNPSSILGTSPDSFVKKDIRPRRDVFNERDILEQRKTQGILHRDSLRGKLKKFVLDKVGTFQAVKGGDPDILLYRVQGNSSSHASSSTALRRFHKLYSCQRDALGYRCSGWDEFGEITNEAILNHIQGIEVPTPLISVQESPARLITSVKEVISNGDEHTASVAVFSLRMLQHIGVLLARNVELRKGRGVQVAHLDEEGEWVVMHWVPREAIVATLCLAQFLELARDKGVIDDVKTKNLLDKDYSIRFGASDFTSAQRQLQPPSLQRSNAMSHLGVPTGNPSTNAPPGTVVKPLHFGLQFGLMTTISKTPSNNQSKPANTNTEAPLPIFGSPSPLNTSTHTQNSSLPSSPEDAPSSPHSLMPRTPSAKQPEPANLSNSSSYPANLGLPYTPPPVFGLPSPMISRHRDIKSHFTAGISGASKKWPSGGVSFVSVNKTGRSIFSRPQSYVVKLPPANLYNV